jgi:hypothetical protein
MDLFDPQRNTYGMRKKKVKTAPITKNSYVPAGLTQAQYAAIRSSDEKKKDSSYSKAASKAFKYLGFNEFYKKRGTDLNQGWKKDLTLGHRMAKTKYDYSGKKQEAKLFESAVKSK